MDTFRLDADDDYHGLCGEIYITLKKYLVFRCVLCDRKFKNAFIYLWHTTKEHDTLGPNIGNLNTQKILSKKPSFETVPERKKNISNTTQFSNDILINESVDRHEKRKKNGIDTRPTDLTKELINLEQRKQKLTAANNVPTQACDNSNESIIEKESHQQICLQESTRKRNKPFSVDGKEPCSSVVSSPRVGESDTELLVPLNETKHDPTKYGDGKRSQKKKVLRTYACQSCPVISTTVREYRRHRKTHKKTYKCPICSEVFEYCSKYTKHLNEHDIKDQFHRCDICCKGFTTADELTIHIALHTDEERADAAKQAYERPYKCPECGFRMKDSANIKSHMRRHSENNRKHECPDCSKRFFTRTELKTHSRKHTGERPFLCPECGEAFTSSGVLAKHKRKQHSARKRSFKCTICSSSFFEKPILKLHMTYHQEERKFTCSYCGAAFKRKTALTSHIMIHKNELTYKCNICEKRFNQSPALSSHMKTHKILNFNTP